MLDDVINHLAILTAWSAVISAILPEGTLCLKMVRVSVPRYTLRGQQVELMCEFDLQEDKLYSVSWYKDHDEFYRYVPKGSPPQHTYWIDGIKVDRLNSDARKVVIKDVPLRSSGMYRCEVSAEAPSFSSVHGEHRMNVVELPASGPEITGEEKIYRVGDLINLNCTSAKSFPPTRLRWYINDKLVGPDFETLVHQHGLITSVVGLRLQVGPEHFPRGHLQVRCVATISPDHQQQAEPSPVKHSKLLAANLPYNLRMDYFKEAVLLVTGTASPVKLSAVLLGIMVTCCLLS